jgi:mono/diheme cytochrome c family protein
MFRPIKIAATTVAAIALIALSTRVAVQAQANGPDTHGLPPAAQLRQTENVKSAPVKVVSTVYDTKKLLSAPKLSAQAYAGQALWQQRCAYCHDGMGQPTYKTYGPWIDSDTVKKVGADALKAVIAAGIGRMPAFRYGLNDQQMDNIVEFLKTVSPSLKPTAAQLAGKAEGGNNGE